MTARPNSFCGQFDVARRVRRSRMLAEAIDRQQAKIESKFDRFRVDLREGYRCEAKPPSAGRES
jgi:hypothetical protein